MMTYSEYWTMVLGDRCAEQLVDEYELVGDCGVWLADAEITACQECELGDAWELWSRHHAKARDEINTAIEVLR